VKAEFLICLCGGEGCIGLAPSWNQGLGWKVGLLLPYLGVEISGGEREGLLPLEAAAKRGS